MLSPDVELVLRVGFELVLKKLQGISFPGSEDTASPGEAFDTYCGVWNKAGDYGQRIKKHFDELMTNNTAARREQLPRLARQLAARTGLTDAKVLEELKKYTDGATETLGPGFLHKLARHTAEDDLRGDGILERFLDDERPRKRRRSAADGAGPSSARNDTNLTEAAIARIATAATVQALGQAGVIGTPAAVGQHQIMNDGSAQRLNERVQAREAFADNGLYLEQAAANGTVMGTPARPTGAGAMPNAGGAGPLQPQRGRTMAWADTPGELPDPMESPTRRAYRPPSYRTPPGTAGPRGRRPTVRWTEDETKHLIRLVEEFGMGSWAAMVHSLQSYDVIKRRNAVDLKDKWRNLCKARPELQHVGMQSGNQPGPHGTPAALWLPPTEQVDENMPPADAEPAGNTALHSGKGAPGAADDGGTGAVAASGRADGGGDGEPAEGATVEMGAAEGGTAQGGGAEGGTAEGAATVEMGTAEVGTAQGGNAEGKTAEGAATEVATEPATAS